MQITLTNHIKDHNNDKRRKMNNIKTTKHNSRNQSIKRERETIRKT